MTCFCLVASTRIISSDRLNMWKRFAHVPQWPEDPTPQKKGATKARRIHYSSAVVTQTSQRQKTEPDKATRRREKSLAFFFLLVFAPHSLTRAPRHLPSSLNLSGEKLAIGAAESAH